MSKASRLEKQGDILSELLAGTSQSMSDAENWQAWPGRMDLAQGRATDCLAVLLDRGAHPTQDELVSRFLATGSALRDLHRVQHEYPGGWPKSRPDVLVR